MLLLLNSLNWRREDYGENRMSLDKGDLNTRLKTLDNSIGKTETKIETIQVTGVDENGFTFTETKTIRTKVPVGDELQTSGLLAEEDKVVKNSTVLGRIEGEVIAGVEAIGHGFRFTFRR